MTRNMEYSILTTRSRKGSKVGTLF
jgi:hypothetical protein